MALKGPASEKQKDFLLELGYSGEVDKLSKAQASLIIDKLIEQRDEREGRNQQPPRRSFLAPILLGGIVVVAAAAGYLWFTGGLPGNNKPIAEGDAPPEPAEMPAPPPADTEPVAVDPAAEPREPMEQPAAEPEPAPSPDPAEPPVAEPDPVDPRVHEFVDITGTFKIEARLKSVTNGVATLTKPDGSDIKVPLDKLSPESAQWIRDYITTYSSAE